MSERKVDPSLLTNDSPSGLKPEDAVNGGLNLHSKPSAMVHVNKKALMMGVGVLTVAAVIATLTFNGTGRNAGDVDGGVPKSNGRPVENRQALWYAQMPDEVVAPTSANLTSGSSTVPLPEGEPPKPQTEGFAGLTPSDLDEELMDVPDLTGLANSPFGTPKRMTNAKPYTNSRGDADLPEPEPTPEERRMEQAAERRAQALEQAMKASLSVTGFTGSAQAGSTGSGRANSLPVSNTAGMMPASLGGQPREQDQNRQERKDQFLKDARNTMDSAYSSSVKTAPRSVYEVKGGSIIPAVMIGGINSDLPGQVIAQVRENVYDSRTGQHLLIPQGSKLIGLYDAHVAYGQKRVLLAWSRVIFPDGTNFDLKGMPGADKSGYAGFEDLIDNHYFKVFGTAVLMSVISAGVQLSQPQSNSSNNDENRTSVGQTVGAALGQQIGSTAMSITQKNLNIQPTLQIRPGYLFNVMVTADMILPPHGAK